MTAPVIIQRGESLPFVFDRGCEPIDGWICVISVKRYPENTASINRLITPTNGQWIGALTAAETVSLPISQQILTAKLVNESTDESDEQSVNFYVGSTGALCSSKRSVIDNTVSCT